MILHGTISKDDFQRNTALQCWNNVRNNVATMLQRCVALKSSLRIVSCNITFKQTSFLSDARQQEMRPFSMS